MDTYFVGVIYAFLLNSELFRVQTQILFVEFLIQYGPFSLAPLPV